MDSWSGSRWQVCFLAKLVMARQENPLPTLISGDFNILHNNRGKQ